MMHWDYTNISYEDGIELASNPETYRSDLYDIATTHFDYEEGRDIHIAVALNPSAPFDALEVLANNQDERIAGTVAKNPNAYSEYEDLTVTLLNHDSDFVKSQVVAHSPNITESHFEQLFNHYIDTRDETKFSESEELGSMELGSALAAHSMAKPEMLSELANDDTDKVRIAVYENENTLQQTKMEIADNEANPAVLVTLVENHVLKALSEKERETENLSEMAKDENTPAETLAELSKSEDWQVRMGVAANGNTPPDVLAELAKDGNEQDRANMEAGNTPLTKEISEELLKGAYSEQERANMLAGDNIPEETLNKNLSEIAKDGNEQDRANMEAGNTPLTKEISEELLKGAYSEQERANMLAGDNIPEETLNKNLSEIAKDGKEHLRSEEKTKETKNKYAAKYQKTSEKLAERGASAGLGE